MGTQILTALLIGLLTAFAFQLLLTSFGIAIGMMAFSVRFSAPDESNVNSKAEYSKAEYADRNQKDSETAIDKSSSKGGIFAGLGVLLTINLVLFSACFLATKFSQINDPIAGAIAGVVIWSAYFLTLTWVSSTTISTLIGSILGLTTGGFRQLVMTIAAALKGQDDMPLAQADAIAMIRQEIQHTLSPSLLDEMIQQSLRQHSSVPQTFQQNPTANQTVIQQTKHLIDQLKQLADADPEAVETVTEQLQHFVNQSFVNQSIGEQPDNRPELSPDESKSQLWQAFESYLHHTSSKQLTVEQVHHQFKQLLAETLATSADQTPQLEFDRNTLKALLKQQKGLDKKQRQQLLRHVETTWNQMLESSETIPQEEIQSEQSRFDSRQPIAAYITKSLQLLDDQLPEAKVELEAILRQNLPQLLSISAVATLTILQRLDHIDWERVFDRIPLQNLDDEQIEGIVTEVRSTAQSLINQPQQWAEDYLLPQTQDWRNQVMQQVDHFQQTIQARTESLTIQAQQRLENTRQAAATAAWWLSATAFTAAISAAIAGALAGGLSVPALPGF